MYYPNSKLQYNLTWQLINLFNDVTKHNSLLKQQQDQLLRYLLGWPALYHLLLLAPA